jgi:VCBS repeat-containing protein
MAFRLLSDSGTVFENGTRTGNVLTNDTSAVRVTQIKAGSGTYNAVTTSGVTIQSSYGVLTIYSAGNYSYAASAADRLAKGATASDTFTYSAVSSSGTTAITTLKFSLTGINDAPVITAATTALNAITEDQIGKAGQTVASFLKSSDADGGALRGLAITSLTSGNGQWQYSTDAGVNWTDVGPVSDTAALLVRSTDLIRFNPNGIDGTTAEFSYRAWDQTSGTTGTKVSSSAGGGSAAFSTATSTATIVVSSVNDAPVAQAASASGDQGGPPITGQLRATDIDSTTLTYTLVADSAVGGAAIIDRSTGAYTFAPTANFNGTAAFNFTASDGIASSAAAVVTIVVAPAVSHAPIATADKATTSAGISLLVDVLANDIDPDGDVLNLTRVNPANNGTVQIESGKVRYTPSAGFTGTDSFSYTMSDGTAAASATATITVGPATDPVTIVLAQDFGYAQYRVSAVPAHSTIDATKATWIVDNSRNDNPTVDNPATTGTGQLSTYPFRVDSAGTDVVIKGGAVWGQVPQASDWQDTYNNSAALRIQAAPNAIIDDWRIDKAWDAIRIANASSNFLIDDAYITDIRDDAVEDDEVMGGTIRDSLFDGTFSGISLGDSDHYDGSANTLVLDGLFMRNKSYLVHGVVTHVSPFKTDTGAPQTTPQIRIVNSVIAIEDPNHSSQARLQLAWDHVVESHGNVFLNMSNTPLPATYPVLPNGFTLLQGQQARDYWDASKAAWMENHDGINDVAITPLPPLPSPIDIFIL